MAPHHNVVVVTAAIIGAAETATLALGAEVGSQGREVIVEDFQSVPPHQILRVHLLVRPEVGLVRVAVAYPVAAQCARVLARLLASSECLKSRHGVRHYRGSVENILGHRGVCILQDAPFPLGAFTPLT